MHFLHIFITSFTLKSLFKQSFQRILIYFVPILTFLESVNTSSTVGTFFQSDVKVLKKLWPLHSWRGGVYFTGCTVRIKLHMCLKLRHTYPQKRVLISKVSSFNPVINIAWILFLIAWNLSQPTVDVQVQGERWGHTLFSCLVHIF